MKWEKYHENAAESAESDSDLEEVDITESESDEEDPLADISCEHISISFSYYIMILVSICNVLFFKIVPFGSYKRQNSGLAPLYAFVLYSIRKISEICTVL